MSPTNADAALLTLKLWLCPSLLLHIDWHFGPHWPPSPPLLHLAVSALCARQASTHAGGEGRGERRGCATEQGSVAAWGGCW